MRLLLPASLLWLLAACSDSGVTTLNNEPTAEITSHANGDTVREGYTAKLRGVVGDADDVLSTLTVTWLVEGVEVCAGTLPDGDGSVACDHLFQAAAGSVMLEVNDPQGAHGSASVELDVQPTDAPAVELTSPTAAGTYYSDQLIHFLGSVADGEDSVDQLVVTLEDMAGADLGLDPSVATDGTVEAYGRLDEGEHWIRLRAVDTTGREGIASAVIVVGPANSAPDCAISAPADGSAGPEGGEVRFEGLVADGDIPAVELGVKWSSNLDGDLGTSTADSDGTVRFAWNDLSLGTHLVTLAVNDDIGATCTTSVYYTVGNPPTLVLSAPTDGSVVNEGEDVLFAATVSDTEDAPTDLALTWASDRDGLFSTAGADSTGAVSFRTGALNAGDHTISITATDPDGLYTLLNLSLTVNALPTAPTVTLAPDPAGTADALTATATGSTDPDGSGTVTYSYAWYEDGVASAASTSAVFPAANTDKAHSYRVLVTPNDGSGDGITGEATLTVSNTAPTVDSVSLAPSAPQVGDTLSCSATTSDADGDTVSMAYAWSDGSLGSTYVASAGDDPGASITCTATADDGDGGTATGSASVTMSNSDPVIASINLSPSAPQVGDTVTCSAAVSDVDGGSPTVTYSWSDGSGGGSYVVSAADDPGALITCTARASDVDGGSASDSASVTVANTDPAFTSVSITPAAPDADDTVTCAASAMDADGGTPTMAYAWDNATTGASLGSGASLDLSTASVSSGDSVRCIATATDSDGASATATDSVTLANRAPSVLVSLSPSTARTDDTLTAIATASDPDGDSLTLTYDWYVDGSLVQSGSGSTLDGSTFFDKDQEVYVEVTADDGAASASDTSSGLFVDNTPPEAPTLSISPSDPTAGDDLYCDVDTESTDADGDSVTYTMAWTVDGVAYAAATTTAWSDDTVDGAGVGDTETWVCTATPNDGDDDGATATASAITESSSYSGTIEMPSTSTVNGFSHGEWLALNCGGRVASRMVLTRTCTNPTLALYQHSGSDTSIQGSYYVMDSTGSSLAYTTFATYSGCSDCWLPHATPLSVTLAAGTYYLGFQNSTSGCDMSGPSIYLDATARTVGIATFDDPRADKPSSDTRGLSTTTVAWQNRWQVDCQ